MKLTKLGCLLLSLMVANVTFACGGHDKHPTMLLDGEPMDFNGDTAEEIFDVFPKEEIPHKSSVNTVGIKLSTLLREVSSLDGMIRITDCGGEHTAFTQKELESKDPVKSNYYLALNRKKVFKLIHAIDPDSKGESMIRRISEIELLTTSK